MKHKHSNYFNACLLDDGRHEPVGFTAYAKLDRQYTAGELILFDATISNIGYYYNADTSMFTCPYDGLYIFSIHFNTSSDYSMYAHIALDNQFLTGTYEENKHGQASAQAVIECIAGQNVWVECSDGSGYMWGDSTYKWSLFSGVLLQAYV